MRRLVIEIILALTLCSILTARCSATEVAGGFGIGQGKSDQSRLIYISLREPLAQGIYLQGKVGGWSDNTGGGRTSSALLSGGPGMLIDFRPLQLRAGLSVGAITSPDAYLGGPFQFNEDLYLGLKDYRGNSIGVSYNHVSSGGIYSPNVGRDFISLELGQEF